MVMVKSSKVIAFFFSLSEFALIEKKTKEKKEVIRYNKSYGVHALQQKRGILRSKYHRKQQRKKFLKTHSCEPQFLANS
jgi:hypothetical protein